MPACVVGGGGVTQDSPADFSVICFLTWGNSEQLIGSTSLRWWSLHRYDQHSQSGGRRQKRGWVNPASAAKGLSQQVSLGKYKAEVKPRDYTLLNNTRADGVLGRTHLDVHLPWPSPHRGVCPTHNPVLRQRWSAAFFAVNHDTCRTCARILDYKDS